MSKETVQHPGFHTPPYSENNDDDDDDGGLIGLYQIQTYIFVFGINRQDAQ